MKPRRLLAHAALLAGALGALTQGCAESKAAEDKKSPATQAVGPCGDKGLPDCPLQSWMKANLQAQLNAGDMTRLARGLDDLAAKAPAGFDNWAASAMRAAEAARKNDVATVKAECKACHDNDRARFRAELRKTALF